MSFWSDRFPVESCRPSITMVSNLALADLTYDACLRKANAQRLDGAKCRGYSIPGPTDLAFFKGSYGVWGDTVIQESVGFCRQWGSINVYVTFQTSIPMGSAFDSNIGRPREDWPGVGLGYAAPAIKADVAVELGIVDQGAVDTFIGEQPGLRPQLTPSVVAAEQGKIEEHQSTVATMEASDDARVNFSDTLVEIGANFTSTLGLVAGKVVAGAGKVFGQGFAGALSGLGPVGVLVVVGGVSVYAIRTFRRR